jgi:hypothetical protein
LVVAFFLLLLSATSGVSGEGNERLEEHRARLRRAVDELVSPDAGVRKDALYGVSRSLLRKGATEIQLLEPAEERLMATRAVAEAISLLAAAPGRASEPLPGSWYARRGLQAMTLYSDVTRQAYADRLADVLPLLDGLDRETRQRVYETFGDLGRLAEPAVPMLGELLKEPESALSAAGALAGIGGEQAKGHLRAAIKQESDKLRESAYHGWMYFATELTLADVQAVAAGLRDADPRVREAASRAFMHQRWQVRRSGLGADALSRLVMSAPLESPEEKVRRAACLLLGMLGEHGRRRADDLAKLLTSDPEKRARRRPRLCPASILRSRRLSASWARWSGSKRIRYAWCWTRRSGCSPFTPDPSDRASSPRLGTRRSAATTSSRDRCTTQAA